MYLALHSQWQNTPGPVPIDPDKPDACSPPWQMERAGCRVAPELSRAFLQTFLLCDLAQTVLLLWFLNTEGNEGAASFQVFRKPLCE